MGAQGKGAALYYFTRTCMVVGSRTSMSWPGGISNATTDRDSSLVCKVGDEQVRSST